MHVRSSPNDRKTVLLLSFATIATFAACSGGNPTPSPRPTTASNTVVLPLSLPTAIGNKEPRLLIAFPSATPIAMALDTGSTGIRILPNVLAQIPATAYSDTATPVAVVFGGDRVYYGTIAIAKAGIQLGGKVSIEKPLAFQAVSAVCFGNIPSPLPTAAPANCDNTTATEEQSTGGAVVGLRPVGTGMLFSPVSELPAPLDAGFVVSAYGNSPALTVGATIANEPGFQTYEVGATTAPDGSPAWQGNAELPWCYTVTVPGQGTTPAACPSGGVLTDSGGETQRLSLPAAPPGSLAPNTVETLPPGSTVDATLGSADAAPSITWTFVTGTCEYYNAPALYFIDPTAQPPPASPLPISNNGIAPFYSHDILFDLVDGALGFRSVMVGAPAFCS